MIRWYLDLAFSGLTVVGKVWQGPPPESIPKGSVRPSAPWFAVGMNSDWCDTDLGNEHASKAGAMRAVEQWAGSRVA